MATGSYRDGSDLSAQPLVEGSLLDGETEEETGVGPMRPRRAIKSVGMSCIGMALGVAVGTACACVPPMLSQHRGATTVGPSAMGILRLAAEQAAKVVAGKNSEDAEVACAADGEACLESKCCAPGGMEGLQCFKKNDNWASCAPSCEPGVHEPEEEGTWDANGVFQKAQWSCDKVGERSDPGCEGYTNKSKSACPKDRCVVKGEKCVDRCDKWGTEDSCWKANDCMWQDSCMDACWSFSDSESCQPTDKCYWTGKQCQLGWWRFFSYDSCDQDLGYKWNGSCVQDECSRVGEDCTSTKCCSTERGAAGMTCFKKDKFWATCQETCDTSGNWSCEALGNRSLFAAGCAWAGKDCSVDQLCCNRGFVCAVKDQDFTGCVLTKKTATWDSQEVPIPSNWEGTVVGAGRDEYEMQKAGPDDKKAGTTLYCWMAFLPGSYEEELIALAEKNKASIYACEKHDLYHTWESGSAGWDTGESTLMNTDVFFKVWQQVAERGDYINYDWTIKVDPDCVFTPVRLRDHINSWNIAEWAPVYVKNNGQDPGLGNNGFLGAIEIFSRKAMMMYMDLGQGCLDAMGTVMGEDGFMKGCMDGLGIGYVMDVDIFFPDNGAGACRNDARVAFHPLKAPEKWQHCWDILLGNREW